MPASVNPTLPSNGPQPSTGRSRSRGRPGGVRASHPRAPGSPVSLTAELAGALAGLKAKTLVLDGEVAVFDRDLVSRFEWLRARPKDESATSPVYIVFDVLELNGRDIRPKPLKERRRVLERLVSNHSLVFPAGRLPSNGSKAWEEAVARGYEGIVAKDPGSTYLGAL